MDNITINGVDSNALHEWHPLVRGDIDISQGPSQLQCLRMLGIGSKPPEKSKFVYFLILKLLCSTGDEYEHFGIVSIMV